VRPMDVRHATRRSETVMGVPAPAHVDPPVKLAAPMESVSKRQALEQLHAKQYVSLVRSAAWIVDDVALAEELVQEGFIRLAGAWDQLEDPEAAGAYLRRIVINLGRSRIRRIVVGRRKIAAVQRDVPSVDNSAARWGEGLLDGGLGQALRNLPQRQRECVVLRYEQDLSVEQIAAALGLAEGSVKSHLHRGLARIRAELNRKETP